MAGQKRKNGGSQYPLVKKARQGPWSGGYVTRDMALAAKRRRFKQSAPQETGFVDLATANYVADTTGSITLLATIAQGASTSQRIGKKIQYKSIQIRGQVTGNSAAVQNVAAYIIVYDRRPTGSLPAITDVLVSANAKSFTNDANTGRFRIIARDEFSVVGNATTFTDSFSAEVDRYVKINLPEVFKAAGTGAIDDIEEGALYLITVGTNAAGTSAANMSLGFRTRYYDV